MKISRLLLVAGLMGFSASVALADSTGTDPVMKLGPGGHSTVLDGGTFSFDFTQTAPPTTSILFDFINNTHKIVTELDLLLTGSQGLVFSCDNSADPYFANCATAKTDSGQYIISYFGLDSTHLGIPYAKQIHCGGEDEWEDWDDNQGCSAKPVLSDFAFTVGVGDMTAGQSFHADGTLSVPEPSSLVLILAGGLLFLFYKRSAFAI